jgi:acetoacetyl-CoA synthetase
VGCRRCPVPDDIFPVSANPRTLSGKKMALPVKNLMPGASAASLLKADPMTNADCLSWFVELARSHSGGGAAAEFPEMKQ